MVLPFLPSDPSRKSRTSPNPSRVIRTDQRLHEPLVGFKTFLKVQDMFVARSSRGLREGRHRTRDFNLGKVGLMG